MIIKVFLQPGGKAFPIKSDESFIDKLVKSNTADYTVNGFFNYDTRLNCKIFEASVTKSFSNTSNRKKHAFLCGRLLVSELLD